MKKIIDLTRDLWIKAQLDSPPFIQHTVLPHLHTAKEITRLLTKPYLPVIQLHGLGYGGPLIVTYAGFGYAKTFLKKILFVVEPVEHNVGQIPFWQCGQLAERFESDIAIVEASKHLIHRLPDQNAIIFPQLVEHFVDTRGEWSEVQSRFHKSVRKNDLRLMRKYGYEYDLSYDPQDFEKFYHHMVLPTTRYRHNQRSMSASKQEAHRYFQSGWLFRVKREGEWVAGVICHPERKMLLADISGIKDGDAQLIYEGATSATYYAAIHWANQNGYPGVNFLGSGPFIQGGLFQHKRKWGSTVTISPYLHRLIWLKVQRITSAVSQFLQDTPLVTVGKDGQLYGLIVVEDPYHQPAEVKQNWEKHCATPGLRSLLVKSVSSFAKEAVHVNKPDLIIPISLTSSFENQ